MIGFESIAAVAIGSAVGGAVRYLVVESFARWFGQGMPWGTIAVNLAGTALIGPLAVWLRDGSSPALLLIVGFCGSLTTFSSVALQTKQQAESGRMKAAGLNVALSVLTTIPVVAVTFYAASLWE